ncbi:hypothetical protein BT69DRAFT_1281821 [Atractiella rhizophila]|nr:hypothetical protein BT69DRAFT_1281821 [Atractiella rhizophila]
MGAGAYGFSSGLTPPGAFLLPSFFLYFFISSYGLVAFGRCWEKKTKMMLISWREKCQTQKSTSKTFPPSPPPIRPQTLEVQTPAPVQSQPHSQHTLPKLERHQQHPRAQWHRTLSVQTTSPY